MGQLILPLQDDNKTRKNEHSCIKLFEVIVKWTKFHFQIMRFVYCLKIGVSLIILKMRPDLLSDITPKSIAARTDHYVPVKVSKKYACIMTL